jgi:hypothetical protein
MRHLLPSSVVPWRLCVALALAAACTTGTGTNPNAICAPGETVACTCFHDAGVGTQTCTENGIAFTECASCGPPGVTTTSSGRTPSSSAADSVGNSGTSRGASSSGGGGGSSSGDTCADRARLIYVVDQDEMLSTFNPATLTFSDVGYLACPSTPGSTTFSMAVQRDATAWVLYSSGQLFRVDTSNARCTATSFEVNQSGMELFGMGFVSNVAGSAAETLHVAGGPGMFTADQDRTLGTVSIPTLRFTATGTVRGSPELTGTGAGELYGFFPSPVTPRAAWLNKTTGVERQTYALPALAGVPEAWAFAFWGGTFWVFLKRDTDASTHVYAVDVVNGVGSLQQALVDTGRYIVGAGVSTCAPLLR